MRASGLNNLYTLPVRVLRSPRFFYATVALFVIEASWIALSGVYPMAYDENTHLGIIRLYAHHPSPFWSSNPAGSEIYGAVSRDPSYLYHYLISFPYHLFSRYVGSETAQVLFLRFFSITLFAIGLVLYRRVLSRTGASRGLINAVLLLLVLTPVVPFLAAQINYDNLLFPLVALTLLLAKSCVSYIGANKRINPVQVIVLLAVCLLTSLVKYAFLPIFAGIFLWLGSVIYIHTRARSLKTIYKQLRTSIQQLPRLGLIGLVLLAVVSGGLFVERYGVNTIRYGTPTPECDQVLSVASCTAYGPWRRNYLTFKDKQRGLIHPTFADPASYTVRTWGNLMSSQLFFTLNGPASGYAVGKPFAIVRYVSLFLGLPGLVLIVWYRKRLRQRFQLHALAVISGLYLFLLWAQEYGDFRHIGLAVAIQARYLVPVLPIIYLVFALAYAQALRSRPYLKAILVWAMVGILLLEGGGAAVFILRSDVSWYWPNHLVLSANQLAQKILGWLAIGA